MIIAAVGVVVVVAAGLGASVRYVVAERLNRRLPYGTLVVNVVAAGLLGVVADIDGMWQPVVGIGALGAMSTWSTVAAETAELARAGEARAAVLYLGATMTCGVLAAWVGLQLG